MRHANEKDLKIIIALLRKIRSLAFLHFHEDKGYLYADLKINDKWKRLSASTKPEQEKIMEEINILLRS